MLNRWPNASVPRSLGIRATGRSLRRCWRQDRIGWPDELAAALSSDAVEELDTLLSEPEAIQDFERTVRDCLTQLELRRLRERNIEIDRLVMAATSEEKDRLVEEKQRNRNEMRRLSDGGSSA